MKYLEIPYKYIDKDEKQQEVKFFLPISFIENQDLDGWKLEPDNFLGVDLKTLLS